MPSRRYLVTLNRSAEIDPAQVMYPTLTTIRANTLEGLIVKVLGRDQRPNPTTTAAPTGAGGFTRTACQRPAGLRAARGTGSRARDRSHPAAGGARRVSLGDLRGSNDCRVAPVENEFRYRVGCRCSTSTRCRRPPTAIRCGPREPGPGPVSSRDFLVHGRTEAPLAERARELVHEQLGAAPAGRCQGPRHFTFLGIGFNPVGFSTCTPRMARWRLVAEVTNTPWGESHRYVAGRADAAAPVRGRFRKRLHVSPSWRWISPTSSTRARRAAVWVSIPPASMAGCGSSRRWRCGDASHPPGDDRAVDYPRRAADAGADLRQRPEAATAWVPCGATRPAGRRQRNARSGRPRSRPFSRAWVEEVDASAM